MQMIKLLISQERSENNLQIKLKVLMLMTMTAMMMTVVPGPNARQRAAFVFSWTGAPVLRCAFGKRDKYVIILNSSTLGLHISSGLMS